MRRLQWKAKGSKLRGSKLEKKHNQLKIQKPVETTGKDDLRKEEEESRQPRSDSASTQGLLVRLWGGLFEHQTGISQATPLASASLLSWLRWATRMSWQFCGSEVGAKGPLAQGPQHH